MSNYTNEDFNILKLFPLVQRNKDLQFLEKSQLILIKVYKEARELDIELAFKEIINKKDIEEAEHYIKKLYNISKLKIQTKYIEIKDFKTALQSYYESIKYYLQKELPISRTLLADSQWENDNGNLYIQLNVEGNKILTDNLANKKIEGLIKEEFDKNIKVIFTDPQNLTNVQKEHQNLKSKLILESLKESNYNQNGLSKPVEKQDKNSIKNKIIIGKAIPDNHIKISEINQDMLNVLIHGEIFETAIKEIKGEKFIVSFNITDYTNSVTVKFFRAKKDISLIKDRLKEGINVKVKGEVRYDKYAREIVIFAKDISETNTNKKQDTAKKKRVELHLHTKMSAMDATSSPKDLISRAAEWGHKAIAITDHGVVQAFPEAYEAGKDNNIKIIYGVECYLLNDKEPIVYNQKSEKLSGDFVVFDIETTGLSPQYNKITEIGGVKISGGKIVDKFHTLVNPELAIPYNITQITGITNDMVKDAPLINSALKDFLTFCNDSVLVAHNAQFDIGFIRNNCDRLNIKFEPCYIDTLGLARNILPELKRHKLNIVAKHLDVDLENHHRAIDDAEATGKIFLKMIDRLIEKGIDDINQINNTFAESQEIKNMPSYHAIILVKDYIGLKNLYKIISESHLNYYYRRPRVPKSLLKRYRQGLIIGSACEAGEVYTAMVEGKPKAEINKIINYYDYLEIQPLANNQFLIDKGMVKDIEDLKNINKQIVNYGTKHNKLVVATCDVHFLDKEDEIFRRILMAGQGYSDSDKQPPLYFRTTDEMLAEFDYLGKEKAYQVVVENTNKISEMIKEISPIPEGVFTPEIKGAEEEIQSLTEGRAKEIYGEDLPNIVKDRMNKELNSIIKNGFAVMYLIAQKLVSKSLSDGYLVGSRGSVGSSFVAFLTGITEVNALPPHYICPNCKYSEFISDGSIGSGADMPPKDCPICTCNLNKDGHDIPFETFLGFDGDKEPDIDLNFSGEYQPIAHRYTEELFGQGYVYRAGTISKIAEKTAYAFVKKYLESKEIVVSNAELNRLIKGCTGVKRSTGQHPGGVIIVPTENEVFEFSPIQRPADDVKSGVITTHFDFNSLEGRLLKLDILGHDDPTILKMLEDLTGVNAQEIPIDDTQTMSLFTTTEALGITEEDVNCKVGTFGIPEFGTRFVRQMLIDTKPKTFAELVRISGLSHGTDVWLNNAQNLIKADVASLPEVICTRDDIMLYLMYKGLDSKHAFKIMESVRRGRGLSEEDEIIMKEKRIPGWYVQSCKKIKYMFPKAHAVAYVTMAFRIAYFKVHYPKAFYTSYFTIKLNHFDASIMINGLEIVKEKIKEIEYKGKGITQKEKETIVLLEVCNEMYCRGIKFLPIDLYKSEAIKFISTEEGILPPLSAISGLSPSAAKNIVSARKEKFMSIEDLKQQANIGNAVIDVLKEQGCLEGMSESSQLSFL